MSTFDIIVIGSGSSGAVIAERLSENPGRKVLLLEAGAPNRHPLQLMPLAFRVSRWAISARGSSNLNPNRRFLAAASASLVVERWAAPRRSTP